MTTKGEAEGSARSNLVDYILPAFLLAMIVAAGLGLRLYNVDWDDSHHLHPDERHITNVTEVITWPDGPGTYFDTENSTLNPYRHVPSFAYGTYPMYLNKALAGWLAGDGLGGSVRHAIDAIGVDLEEEDGTPRFDDGYGSHITGRFLAALFDIGTLLLVFGMARRLYGTKTGLVAALLLGVTVLHLQHAHFFVNESFLVFFVTAVLFFAVRLVTRGNRWDLVGIGAALGAAAATKVSAAPVTLIVVIACIVYVRRSHAPPWKDIGAVARRYLPVLLGVGAIAFVVFRVLAPYAFQGPGFFGIRPNPQFVSDLKSLFELQAGTDFPPNYQWVGRIGPVFLATNLVLWGLGIPLTIAAAIGAWRAGSGLRSKRLQPQLILVLWAVVMFVVVSRGFVVPMRYLLPAYPALVVLAAGGVSYLFTRRKKNSTPSMAGRVVAAGLVVTAVVWGVGFVAGVYGRDNTRIDASEWIYENVPEGSVLILEEWDDGLPLPLDELTAERYRSLQFMAYSPDSTEKSLALVDLLDEADFVIQSSDRASGSVARIPARFPSSINYYEGLEDGSLGFEKAATFTRGFLLPGFEVSDSGAEEAFTVYDHAEVAIYEKTPDYSREVALEVIEPERADAAIPVIPSAGDKNASQLFPDEYAAQQEGGTWTEVFSGTPFGGRLAWLWWFLWLQLAGLAVVPWVTRVFRALPDSGYGLSKVIGLIATTIPMWLLVSSGAIEFSRATAWAGLLGVVAVGVAIGWRKRDELVRLARERWPRWVAVEIVFALVFFGFLLIRAAHPDLWHAARGGEKPMEMAFFSAIARSSTFPPFDPWFAGGTLNYYYVGWLFLAAPTRALGIAPEIAFNLGIPTFAALAGSVAFSNVGGIVSLSRRDEQGGSATRAFIGAGSLGVLMLVVFGNLNALRQVVAMALDGGLTELDWWASSRVYVGNLDVTEFPYWSYIFGDLHPHVMGIPFFGLVIGTGIAFMAAGKKRLPTRALAVALGVATALPRLVHTWDVPLAVCLGLLVMGAARLLFDDSSPAQRLRAGLADLGLFILGHLVVSLPVLMRQEIFYGELTRPTQLSPLGGWLTHFGLFLLVLITYVLVRFKDLAAADRTFLQRPLTVAVGFGSAAAGVMAFVTGIPVVGVSTFAIGLFAILLVDEIRGDRNVGRLALVMAAIVGFGVAAIIDIVVVANDVERMNTAFKFLYQSWHLLALAGACAVWAVGTRIRERMGERVESRARTAWWWATAGIVAIGLLFAIVGTPARLRDRFGVIPPTLDGLAYLGTDPVIAANEQEIHLNDDLELIRWLRNNVSGTPTIVETPGPLYQWTSRISINTGLPTVIGWDWHERQQRGVYSPEIQQRVDETNRFFGGTDEAEAARFLLRYDVTYVVIGTVERAQHAPEGIETLEGMRGLDVVFRSEDGVILETDHEELASLAR